MKFSEILEKFESIESELELDKSIIQGVPWWDLVRYPLFENIFAQFSEKKKDINLKNNFIIRLCSRINSVTKSLFLILSPKSPIWIQKETNLIWGHPRRKLENGKFTDIYSDAFIDLFPSSVDFTVIERSDNNKHLTPFKKTNVFYGENLLSLAYLIQIFKKIKFNQEELLLIEKLQFLIDKNFSYQIDIKRIINIKLRSWFGIFPLMCLFFKIKKPKNLFIVVSAGNEAIVAAAKNQKIPSFELQHGSPTRGKLNYDYSSGLEKKSFPDWFLSFGDYWTSEFKIPVDKKKIIPIGYSYLNKKISHYAEIKKENRLIIISQPKYSRELAELAIDISQTYLNKLKIEFRPHPMEINSGKKPKYFKKLEDSGILISNPDTDLYEILAKSRWQIGVYSTALYEGLCFGVACFVFDVPRAELMKNLFKNDLARTISTAKDFDLEWQIDKKKMNNYFCRPNRDQINFLISLMSKK